MSSKFLKTTSIKRLFLVCPTDSMEQPILNHFVGEGYFYTGLGVYFEFDGMVQSQLWDLICKHGIEKIVFVAAINNVFYQEAFNENVNHQYAVDEALPKTKKKIFKDLIRSEVFSSNLHLLVAHHLKNQKERLLSTYYLGNLLREKNIFVDAFVYQPEKKIFSCYDEVEKMGDLLNGISYN